MIIFEYRLAIEYFDIIDVVMQLAIARVFEAKLIFTYIATYVV